MAGRLFGRDGDDEGERLDEESWSNQADWPELPELPPRAPAPAPAPAPSPSERSPQAPGLSPEPSEPSSLPTDLEALAGAAAARPLPATLTARPSAVAQSSPSSCPHCGVALPEDQGRFCDSCGLSVMGYAKRDDEERVVADEDLMACRFCGVKSAATTCPECGQKMPTPDD